MRVIGHSVLACLLVQALRQHDVPLTWYAAAQPEPFPLLPDLQLLPGPLLGLLQQGRQGWRQAAAWCPRAPLAEAPAADLATTPGREAKLSEEALLDALAGEPLGYEEGPPPGLNAKLVRGRRWQPNAPRLAEGLHAALLAALAAEGLAPQPLPPNVDVAWLEAELTTLTDATLVAACYPALGLRPRRAHALRWSLAQPLPLPTAPLQLLHRMPRGHAWWQLTETDLTLWYDGLADPRQATLEAAPDDATVAALIQHTHQLLPLLAAPGVAGAPQVWASLTFQTRDGLPLVGPLTPTSSLWLFGEGGLREAAVAPALVARLLELWQADEEDPLPNPYAPQRLPTEAPAVPESLHFTEPTAAAPAATTADVAMRGAVVDVAAPDVQRATEVRMVSREPSGPSMKPATSPAGSKPRIQMASIKKEN